MSALKEKLAATYSRGVYKTTTIGKTVFDGRVRNGIGSDHSFMATKKTEVREQRIRGQKNSLKTEPTKISKEHAGERRFSENCTQEIFKGALHFAS